MKPTSSPSMMVQLAALASAAIPLTISILNATVEPYWLDSPEFTAAVQTLGIPHPPGHPLYVMLTKPFTLLPFGTIGFRVSLASAAFGAVAAYLLFKSSFLVLSHATDAVPEWFRAALALCASLIAAVTHAWWFQTVRQEVYALQILLVMAALYPVLKFSLTDDIPEKKIRLLIFAAFVFGLGLTNHHFIMLVSLPAALPAMVSVVREETRSPVVQYAKMVGAVIFGLLPYLFLYLRSLAGVPVAFGGVHSLKDFFWVVSAKVYQKSVHQESAAYLQDNAQEAILSLMGQLGPWVVVISLAGAYLLLRRKSTRLTGVILLLLQTVTLFMRSLMGIDPFNPDYYGYILATVAVTALFFSVALGVAAHVMFRTFAHAEKAAPILAILCILLPVFQAREAKNSTNLREFKTTRIVFDAALSDAPAGTVAISSYYKLFFVLHSAKYIDGSRPDIHVVNPQLFGYPGYLATVTTEMPDLKRLAWSIFVKGEITEKAISDLALKYSLRVEPSPWSETKTMMHLLPSPFLFTAIPEPTSITDVNAVSGKYMKQWQEFYNLLGTDWQEHETWRFLSWSHYLDAIYFAQIGDRASAQRAIDYSHTIGSSPKQLNDLEDELRRAKGPVDIRPFRSVIQSDEETEKEDALEVFR